MNLDPASCIPIQQSAIRIQNFLLRAVILLTMGRPWEHDRWRRLLMQAVMFAILGGTLGLAQLITYSRNHTPITLGPPRQLGPLRIRLPEDWVSLPGEGVEPDALQAEDEDGTRELLISIQSPSPGTAPQVLGQPQRDAGGPMPIGFMGLGLRGVEQIVPHLERTPDGKIGSVDILVASAELPTGDWVQIEFRNSDFRFGSADRLLVQAVADGITLADRKSTGNEPRSAPSDPSNSD
jgi:hypothetical protein